MQMCQLLTRICPKGNLLPILHKPQPYKADSVLKNMFQDYEKLCLYQDYISFVKNQKSITMLSRRTRKPVHESRKCKEEHALSSC